jgi:hypothetical protein
LEATLNVTLDDCIALCGLEHSEVAAIAEHEHLPEIAAAALAQYLLGEPGGPARIRDMLVDDFRNAMRRNDKAHARELLAALRHFTVTHRDELLSERGAATPEAERA